jgi:hypothetical protein
MQRYGGHAQHRRLPCQSRPSELLTSILIAVYAGSELKAPAASRHRKWGTMVAACLQPDSVWDFTCQLLIQNAQGNPVCSRMQYRKYSWCLLPSPHPQGYLNPGVRQTLSRRFW